MTSTLKGAKEAVRGALGSRRDTLVELSHAIHARPELAFEEHYAAEQLTDLVIERGMDVTTGICDLPTAFSARAGDGPLVVAVCAEYDALPGIGHACGHNIIAAASVGAALALAEVAEEAGLTVLLVGTPAEEGGGGKVLMLERGAFRDAHLAMMVHPWPADRLTATCLAVSHFDVHFEGKEAHAAASPYEGVNAADAMTVSQVAIALLRQQFRPGDQAHGVVLEAGRAANVIPAKATGRFMCRARTLEGLALIEPRIRRCFEAGALATGTTVSFEELSPVYSHMVSDPDLLAAYRRNAETLGRRFPADDAGDEPPTISTDMANVSLALPSIHPMIGIESAGAVNHQPEFARACTTESADAAIVDGALALAWTALDAATTGPLRQRLLERVDGPRS
jgi:amidohydrolase